MKIKRCQQRVSEVACEWWTYLISAPRKHINNSWRKLLFVKKKKKKHPHQQSECIFWMILILQIHHILEKQEWSRTFFKLFCESLSMIKDNTVQKQHVSNCEWQHSYLNYRTVFIWEKKKNEMNNVNNDLIIASLWFCISVAWFMALSQVFMSSWVSALK